MEQLTWQSLPGSSCWRCWYTLPEHCPAQSWSPGPSSILRWSQTAAEPWRREAAPCWTGRRRVWECWAERRAAAAPAPAGEHTSVAGSSAISSPETTQHTDWLIVRQHSRPIGYLGDSFIGQKTQPTVSKHWRKNHPVHWKRFNPSIPTIAIWVQL